MCAARAEVHQDVNALPQVLPGDRFGSIITMGNYTNYLILFVGGDGLEPPALSV